MFAALCDGWRRRSEVTDRKNSGRSGDCGDEEAEEEEIGKTIESFYGIDIYIVYTFVVVRLDVKSNKIQFNIYIVFCAFIFLIQPYVYIAFFGCIFIIQYYAYIRYTNSTISIQSYMRYTYTIVANMYNTAR